jgi:hypothetical protein
LREGAVEVEMIAVQQRVEAHQEEVQQGVVVLKV